MTEHQPGPLPVLVVDAAAADTSADWSTLLGDDFHVTVVHDGTSALEHLEAARSAIVLVDAKLERVLLDTIAAQWPEVVRLVMGNYTATSVAVKAINEAGAFGFLPLPLNVGVTLSLFQKAADCYRDHRKQVETIAMLRAALSRMEEQITQVEVESVSAAASVDAQTELWDRQHLIERLEDEANRLARYKAPFGVVAIQVPATPAQLEFDAAELLRDFVRRVDVAARMEPHRFFVLCPSTDENGMRRLPDRIQDAFTAASLSGSPAGEAPRLAVATVALTEGKVSADEVLARLQMALRAATESGDVVHYNSDIH